jgi:simple sugar transport system permease protein
VHAIRDPRFATVANLLDLIKSYSFFGILSVGVLVVLLSGGIDISFTATAQVAEYVTVSWILAYGGNLGTDLQGGIVGHASTVSSP